MLAEATTHRVGRKKEFEESLRLPLAAGTTARIDAMLAEGEPRLDLIRDAIERELVRRARITRNPASPRGSAKSLDEE